MALKSIKLPKPVRFCLLTGVLVLVYLIIAVPFKVMSIIPGFTDIRPVMLFKPVYGVFFGIPGCFACAIGNLIGDVMSDSLRWSSIAGFAANFLGPFVFYLFWVKLSKTAFSLRTGKALLKQTAVIVVSAVMEAAIIAPAVQLMYDGVNLPLLVMIIFFNGSIFPLMPGIPLMMLMQDELGFVPCAGKNSVRSESL